MATGRVMGREYAKIIPRDKKKTNGNPPDQTEMPKSRKAFKQGGGVEDSPKGNH